jgi:alpha-D-ribose 1-methylphosphonate 5-triphosphate synthase subunit PhnL
MSLLAVKHLTKSFTIHHLERTIPAFAELSFELDEGEFLLVRGPNGVGKSTLLRCLYRSYLPSSGEAIYQSEHGPIDLAKAADIDITYLRNNEIGFVTQFLRTRPRVTARELVAEPLIAGGAAPDDAFAKAEAMLARFGLKPELWNAYPATFSGGEQQKVNLAHTLITPRRLILLDEPTASLDKPTRESLAVRLGELKSEGVAMIGVLHHAEDAAGLVDRDLELTLPGGATPIEPAQTK